MKPVSLDQWKRDRRFRPLKRAGIDIDDGWMWMGTQDGWTTYKRYCDHDEHGRKEYVTVDADGASA